MTLEAALVILLLLLITLSAAASPDDALAWQTVYSVSADRIPKVEGVTVPNVTGLEAAHGGGNRVYWRITFDRAFATDYTVLILYLDTDNDESTGRISDQFKGADRMLTLADGVAGAIVYGAAGDGRGTTARIDGKTVTFRDDMAYLIPFAKQKKPFDYELRARILHHKAAVSSDQTGTPWFTAEVRIDPGKPRSLGQASGESLIADLLAYGDGKDALQIRFTTPEPMVSEVSGDGSPARKWAEGIATNHGWVLTGIPTPGKVSYQITLSDDLGCELEKRSFEYVGKPRETPVDTAQRRKVRLTLDVDSQAIAACKDELAAVKWPVAGSVPFPQGALYSADHVRLLDPNGAERQAQVSVLSRWRDESVRWLLVEFIAQLPGDAAGDFALEYGSSVVRANAPAADVWFSGIGDLWTDMLTVGKDDRATKQPWQAPNEADDGPVRHTRFLQGRYISGCCSVLFGYQVRLHGYPGLPIALIEHTLTVERGYPMTKLESLRLVFPACESAWQPAAGASSFSQINPPEASEIGNACLVSVDTPTGKAFIAVREFAQNWPKAMVADAGHIAVDLFPKLDVNQYADRKEPKELLYFWFDKGAYVLRPGVHKTHEILYVPAGSGVSEKEARAYAFWLDSPPVLRANPRWVCSSGAAGLLEPNTRSAMPQYEDSVCQDFEATQKTHIQQKEHGFINFGDWYGEREHNWGNNEYDMPEGMWLQWLRSGEYRYFRRSIDGAHHMSDIDITHTDASPMNVGRMWGHSLGHTGGYFEAGSLGMQAIFCIGFWDVGHTYCAGLLHVYLATGNRRYLESGLAVADQLARFGTVNYKMASERSAGWPLVALTSAYEFAREPYYLNACKIIAREALRRQDATRGGWFARIGECTHNPPHYGGKPFMTGTLITGLSRLHRLLPDATPEDRAFKKTIADSLLRGCDWLLKEAWLEEYGGFFYAQCPDYYNRACGAAPWMVSEGLAYASEITGDPKYIQAARKSLETVLARPDRGFGKSLGMETVWTPRLLAALGGK